MSALYIRDHIMAEFAPLFSDTGNILPKNTNPLTDAQTQDALVASTVGAAAGGATATTRARVKHNAGSANDNGGRVTVESIAPINRVSTAADVTAMKSKFTKKNASLAFPRDLSGNGGPAFTRT
jgi:hypothetical protein